MSKYDDVVNILKTKGKYVEKAHNKLDRHTNKQLISFIDDNGKENTFSFPYRKNLNETILSKLPQEVLDIM